MEGIIKVFFIINLIFLVLLLILFIKIGIDYCKIEKQHKKEKLELKASRDFHIRELEKRAKIDNEGEEK